MSSKHTWVKDGEGIEYCTKCQMYRCTAPGYYAGSGRPRAVDTEYSDKDGWVLALNPVHVPECSDGQ